MKQSRQKPSPRPRLPRRRYCGRGVMIFGALLLLIMTGYETWVRWDDLNAFISSVQYFSEVRQESFLENLAVFLQAPAMNALLFKMIFLLGCVIFSTAVLILRNRPMAAYVLLPADLAAFLLGCFVLGMLSLDFGNILQAVKLLPLLMIFCGCVMNLSEFYVRRHRQRRQNRSIHVGQTALHRPEPIGIPESQITEMPPTPDRPMPERQPVYQDRHGDRKQPYFDRNRDSEYWQQQH